MILKRSAAMLLAAVLLTAPLTAQSRPAEPGAAAWKALQTRDLVLASKLFNEALAARPNDALLMFGAGAAAYLQGRMDEARWRLRFALDVDPRITDASRLLGAIAYEGGDLDLAISIYEKGLQYAPADEGLAKALAQWRKDADRHSSFTERRDRGFTVLYEGRAEEATAQRALDILNVAFRRVADRLRVSPSNAIYVVLYTEQQFHDVTQSPQWAGGVYDTRIRVPTVGASKNPALFEHVLTHELVHAVIAGLAPRRVPAWLHEGLAQYLAGADVDGARRRVKALPALVPLKDLEKSFITKSAVDARVAYDISLVAGSLLFERAGAGWGTFFSDLADGTPCDAAMVRRFGMTYQDLEAAIAR